jgi:hypothetical protein
MGSRKVTPAKSPPGVRPGACLLPFRFGFGSEQPIDCFNHALVGIGAPLMNVPLRHFLTPSVLITNLTI